MATATLVAAQTDGPYDTIKETAQRLKLKEAHVRALIDNGTIPAVQIGRLWRIDRLRLEARLAELSNQPSQHVTV